MVMEQRVLQWGRDVCGLTGSDAVVFHAEAGKRVPALLPGCPAENGMGSLIVAGCLFPKRETATFSLMLLWKSLGSLGRLMSKPWCSRKHRSYSSEALYGEMGCIWALLEL